ncbi:hypothetical protein [Pedobacter metabolipauper]|uniref:Uncharacterized protein n=1 Tax=Pedobacter metabolipauper TaxID=425513 RepID=A0A4R6SZT2_9SPHI|nr:hypothetical protein [Pedobacter metabolipauper]TDQ11607.1 hypothetical protein ATK78_0730 [Pedobacter metabolipauper]
MIASGAAYTIPLSRLGLKESSLKGQELFNALPLKINGDINYTVPGSDAALIKIKID